MRCASGCSVTPLLRDGSRVFRRTAMAAKSHHSPVVIIPSEFARITIAREGEAGRAWLARLPDIAASYLERWSLTPDGDVLHGHVGIVLPVRRADGEPAMLKVSWQEGDVNREARTLAAWNGR